MMTDGRIDILGLLPDEMEAALAAHFSARNQPRYRAGQAREWLYERDALSFEELTNLPVAERAALADAFLLTSPEAANVQRSTDGTVKQLWRMSDGELVESVIIPIKQLRIPILDKVFICFSMPSFWSKNHHPEPNCTFPLMLPSLKLPIMVAITSLSAGFKL